MIPWPVLVASLLGSGHCAAMCGPIAGAAGRGPAAAVGYHGARLLLYVALGALAGLAGTAADAVGQVAEIGGLAARLAGGALVVFGLGAAATALGIRLPWRRSGSGGLAARVATAAHRLPGSLRPPLLGIATGFLPCGWLYAFVAAAAGTGRAGTGALAMAAFWIGTVPAVIASATLVRRLAGPLRARLPLLAAAAMIVFGLLTAFRGSVAGPPGPIAHHGQAR